MEECGVSVDHRRGQRRSRRPDRCTPSQIPQQHRRTIAPQAGNKAQAQLQIVPPPSSVLAGIGLMHMIRKGQFEIDDAEAMSFADQFSAMAGVIRPV